MQNTIRDKFLKNHKSHNLKNHKSQTIESELHPTMNDKSTLAKSESMVEAELNVMEGTNRGSIGAFELLPDDLLLQIGKTVLELSGAQSFVHLTSTCKFIHVFLREDEGIISKAIQSEIKSISDVFKLENENYVKYLFTSKPFYLTNERMAHILRTDLNQILEDEMSTRRCPYPIFMKLARCNIRCNIHPNCHSEYTVNANPSVTIPTNFEELALCQSVAEAKTKMEFTVFPDVRRFSYHDIEFDSDMYGRQLEYIVEMVTKHPSLLVIMDCHTTWWDDDMHTKIWCQVKNDLTKNFAQLSGSELKRIRMRKRSNSCLKDLKDSLKQSLKRQKVFFEFGFRLGGIEVPPLRSSKRDMLAQDQPPILHC